jgi:transposase
MPVPRGDSSQADADHGRPHPRKTTAMAMLAELVDGVIGVDNHRDTLTAAAVTKLGGVLARTTTSADAAGYQRLLDFALLQLPGRRCWAVEGAGSFGAGLAGFLQQHGEQVLEIARPKRPASRSGAKSDALDAVRAAREALGQDHLATPRGRGEREALRVLLTTRRCATLARVAAIGQLKALIVGAPEELEPSCVAAAPPARSPTAPAYGSGRPGHSSTAPPSARCEPPPSASNCCRPRPTSSKPSSPRSSTQSPFGCWRYQASAPSAPPRYWSAGRMPVGSAPRPPLPPWPAPTRSPASSGQVTRYRLNRAGDRQLNRALHTILLVRLRVDPDTPHLHGPPHRPGQEPPRRQAVPATRHRPPAVPAARTLRPTGRRNPPGSLTRPSSLTLGPMSHRRQSRRVRDRRPTGLLPAPRSLGATYEDDNWRCQLRAPSHPLLRRRRALISRGAFP